MFPGALLQIRRRIIIKLTFGDAGELILIQHQIGILSHVLPLHLQLVLALRSQPLSFELMRADDWRLVLGALGHG